MRDLQELFSPSGFFAGKVLWRIDVEHRGEPVKFSFDRMWKLGSPPSRFMPHKVDDRRLVVGEYVFATVSAKHWIPRPHPIVATLKRICDRAPPEDPEETARMKIRKRKCGLGFDEDILVPLIAEQIKVGIDRFKRKHGIVVDIDCRYLGEPKDGNFSPHPSSWAIPER